MSLKKSAKRRLSWLAGSSLAAAGLVAVSALAPTAASAQTCSPATAPGANPGPDTYDCLAGTFPTGITYVADGNLTVNMIANGAVVNSSLTANGANLTAAGADSVTWNSTIGTVTGAAGTAGPVIDALSVSGAINISTAGVTGSAASVTHAVRARSTSGAINISTGAVSATATTGVNAIEAVTAGNINVSTAGILNGRVRNIFTNTSSGSGTTTITMSGTQLANAGTPTGGGIEAITGSGALTVNLNTGSSSVATVKTGGAGVATINIGSSVRLAVLDPNSSALVTLNIGQGGVLGDEAPNSAGDFLLSQGGGSGPIVINNDGGIKGRFNLAAATGPITIHNNTGLNPLTQGWHTGGLTTFGSGNDLIDNPEGGAIAGTYNSTFNFGAGQDSLVNAGRLIVARSGGGSMTLTGLEVLENTGVILLGSFFLADDAVGLESDLIVGSRLVAPGVAYTGSGQARIALDVKLAEITQQGCPTTLTAADCIDFTGGSTSGSTLLTIGDQQGIGYNGALNDGITLIVGSSAAGDFTLDPNSDYYARTASGAVLQKKLVAYRLVYDDAADSHKLVGTLADEAFQVGTFVASAQETWRATTGSWLTRQADLRATPGGLADSGGAWGRIGSSASQRDTAASYTQGATTFDYDVSHSQRTSHLVVGADMLRTVSGDSAAVVGAMVGFVRSDVEYEATPTEAVANGFTGGLYASYAAGPFFVDGVLNFNLLHLKADAPNMNLGQNIPLRQDIRSVGAQVEAGWRIDVGGAFVEPLGALAYVTTRTDDFDVPGGGGRFDFDDKYTSLRAGGGLRLGLDSQLLGVTSSYSLTGRFWQETQAKNAASVFVTNGATTTPLIDDFSGGFSEIAGGVSLYSEGGAVSGFLSLGGKFADGYRSIDGSVGVRLRW